MITAARAAAISRRGSYGDAFSGRAWRVGTIRQLRPGPCCIAPARPGFSRATHPAPGARPRVPFKYFEVDDGFSGRSTQCENEQPPPTSSQAGSPPDGLVLPGDAPMQLAEKTKRTVGAAGGRLAKERMGAADSEDGRRRWPTVAAVG